MRAVEMIDHRADLIARLADADVRRAWGEQVNAAVSASDRVKAQVGRINLSEDAITAAARSNAAASIQALRMAMGEAEVFHVAPDLTALTVFAASQLNETDRIDRSILPTRSGLARFEGGLPYTDIRGRIIRISWLGWGPVVTRWQKSRHDVSEPEEATAIWMWNDHRDEPDEIAKEMDEHFKEQMQIIHRIYGRWGFIGHEMLINGLRIGPAWIVPPESTKLDPDFFDPDSLGIPQQYTNSIRLVHAFFLLLGQTVTASRSVIPDRPRRRRAERAKLPARVTVVSLRNVESSREPGESLVAWSHRWVVRGFWRWQACGPDHGLAQELEPGKWRARMWIAPYVKGPKDKPLIISDKVYSVHR